MKKIIIDGIETRYYVTEDGKIWSDKHKLFRKTQNYDGYRRIGIFVNNKNIKYMVHRLVAQAYIPNPNNLPFINHINNIRDDNRIENLEWCTAKQNVEHILKQNRNNHPKGEKVHNAILTNDLVLELRKLYSEGIRVFELSKKYNLKQGTIHNVVKNKCWKHL